MDIKHLLLVSWPQGRECSSANNSLLLWVKRHSALLLSFIFSKLWKASLNSFKTHGNTRLCISKIQRSKKRTQGRDEGERIVSKQLKRQEGFFLHGENVLFWNEWIMFSNVKQNMSHQEFPNKIWIFKRKKKSCFILKGLSEIQCFENN